MSNALTNFFATATPKAAAALVTALERLPADKRPWSPASTSRSALDMVAECAMLNGTTAHVISHRAFPEHFDFTLYQSDKAKLAQDEARALELLQENTAKVVAALQVVPEADLKHEVQMPWGLMKLEQIIAYPYWNMSYHEGQINYIASLLGCLN